MKKGIKILLIILAIAIILALSLGLGLGLGLKNQSSQDLQISDYESVGSYTSPPYTGNYGCSATFEENYTFNDDLIKLIANSLDISDDCILERGEPDSEIIESDCSSKGNGAVMHKEYKKDGKYQTLLINPRRISITDDQIKQLSIDVNNYFNSKDYVLIINVYYGPNNVKAFILEIVNINTTSIVSSKLYGLNPIYAGYPEALDKFVSTCRTLEPTVSAQLIYAYLSTDSSLIPSDFSLIPSDSSLTPSDSSLN